MTDDSASNEIETAPGAERARRRGPFDYGELRLIVLGLMSEQPRHGYELIKLIEERMGGGYSPSPGVIYPTLSWLEGAGYATPELEGGRKRFRATPEGEAYLAANEGALAEIAVYMGGLGSRGTTPEAVLRGLDEIKRALRQRFAQGGVEDETIARIAATLREAARAVGETVAPVPDPATMLRSVADVATPAAESYLTQLCAHFARRAAVRRDGGRGKVTFTLGACEIEARKGSLRLTASAADAEALGRVEYVIESHLARFAIDEKLGIDWLRA